MAEYINRTDVMKICESYSEHCFNSNDSAGQDIADRILDDVAEIPTADVVEAVRCKDCILHEEGCPLDAHPYMTADNGYCYLAKRTPKERGRENDKL